MSPDQKLAKGVAHTAVQNALQKVDAPGPDGGLVLLQSAQVQGDWPPLLPRRMQPVDPGAAVSGADELLKVMQFNVLADGLSANCEGKGGFTLIPHEGLVWRNRRHRLLEEVLTRDPDIICLQEVDHYHDWFAPQLSQHGYQCVFRADPASPCKRVAVEEPKLPDGVCVAWKKSKLSLVSQHSAEDVQLAGCEEKTKNKLIVTRLRRSNGQHVVVAGTHLEGKKNDWGKKVRAAQVLEMLEQIAGIASPTDVVFVAGDFNAPRSEPCWSEMEGHQLNLHDAYERAGFDAFTSWKIRSGDFKPGQSKCAVDYIFHSPAAKCIEVLELPLEDAIGTDGLPTLAWPSDHVSLVASFAVENF